MRMSGLAFRTAFACSMVLPLAAQDLPRPKNGIRAQSLQDLHQEIAWYGAYCVMGAREIKQYGHIASLSSIAEDTGVPLAAIAAVAAALNAEHAIAVAVLYAGREPLRRPTRAVLVDAASNPS